MVRLGFVGFGRMGITHFSILKTNPAVEIVGVAEPSKAMRALVERHLGAKTFDDARALVQEGGVDAVVVCTPNDSHAESIEFALARGAHVFVEKPFVMDRGDGERILQTLAEKPIVNQVGYVNRFNEVFQEVKRLLDGGAIGGISNYRSEMYGRTVLKDGKGTWRGKKKSGGGVLFDLGSHAIDLAVYLFGAPARVCGSALQRVYSSEVEDFLCSTFLHDDGRVGTVRANWSDESHRKASNVIEVFGTRGKILADRYGYKLYLRDDDPARGLHKGWNERSITDLARGVRLYVRGNEFTLQLDHFVDCIESGGKETASPFREAFVTDCLMDDIRRDASSEGGGPGAGGRRPRGERSEPSAGRGRLSGWFGRDKR